eukprot:509184_1
MSSSIKIIMVIICHNLAQKPDTSDDQCFKKMMDVINLNLYPIHNTDAGTSLDLMNSFHSQFWDTGLLVLPKFILPHIAKQLAEELLVKQDIMWKSIATHNIYQYENDDPSYSSSHPRNSKMHTECLCLPYDQIPQNSMIRRVYDWQMMTRFISRIVNGPSGSDLYRFADPLGALTVNVLLNNHTVDWHFDEASFVVIIVLQNGEIGGLYEVAAESRLLKNGTNDFALHNDVINGVASNVISYKFEPGTLVIHRGTHSLHRVTKVYGNTPRVSVLLTYADAPNMTLSPSVRQTYYGRGN